MKDSEQTKYERAKKRVDKIKGFYSHLKAYIIINILLLVLRANVLKYLMGGDFDNLDFQRWLDWNTYLTPILWGIGLALHGIFVFHGKIGFVKSWEDRKLKEFMEKEDNDADKYI